MTQDKLMTHDPATGVARPYPSHAAQWRTYHGQRTAWLFNPWTGHARTAGDIGSDTFGHAISDGSPMLASDVIGGGLAPIYAQQEQQKQRAERDRFTSAMNSSIARQQWEGA